MDIGTLLFGPNYGWAPPPGYTVDDIGLVYDIDERGVGLPPDGPILTWFQHCMLMDEEHDARSDHEPHFGSCQEAADAGYGDDDDPPDDDMDQYIEYLYLRTICNPGRRPNDEETCL